MLFVLKCFPEKCHEIVAFLENQRFPLKDFATLASRESVTEPSDRKSLAQLIKRYSASIRFGLLCAQYKQSNKETLLTPI